MTEEESLWLFEAKVLKKGPDECWLWLGSKTKEGYGSVRRKGKLIQSSRLSYELYIGNFPTNLQILHRCDNPSCVNPSHLFLGTDQDNKDDMVQKCRSNKGTANPNAKLTAAQVKRIREFASVGITQGKLAKFYKVALRAIWAIVNFKAYKEVI